MERILSAFIGERTRYVLLGFIIGIILWTSASNVLAAQYTAVFTGYAMGRLLGAANVEVKQSHFANHPLNSCDDPAANWKWGTKITTLQSITLHRSDGRAYSRRVFYLQDNGDPNCYEESYWVDIYFGRFRYNTDPCACPGSPSPQSCITGRWNSCEDASSFGRRTMSYTQP